MDQKTHDFVERFADSVLGRLEQDGGPPWRVRSVLDHVEKMEPLRDSGGVRHLLVEVDEQNESHRNSARAAVSVYFTVGIPLIDAVMATADQLQEHAIQAMSGAALPACPGHPHPLRLQMENGGLWWMCPRDARHHSEPVPLPD